MTTNTAERLDWPAAAVARARSVPAPDPEPSDLAACLTGPNGLELVVELVLSTCLDLGSARANDDASRYGRPAGW